MQKIWALSFVLFCAATSLARADGVDQARLLAADGDTDNWLTYGRTFSEQRFVPLAQINADNVSKLGLTWYADIPTLDGFASTPLVIDGRIYITGSFANVYAVDARSGALLWRYDPVVDPSASLFTSWASRTNRGLAAWGDKLYVGTGDCRLIALDAATGKPVWQVKSCDSTKSMAINGAPRAAAGKVFIGNGGSDLGARGYVVAYAADTGKELWRFYTVPRNPALGQASKILEMAAKTWRGGEWWQFGGGSAWDAIVYDAEFNQLIFGTDSAGNWDHAQRSPDGGDNLFTESIIAVDADTGEYRWHYQQVPADSWDFNAAMPIILADLEIDHSTRKVLMQAPKNGFFYVLERANGRLISAEKFTTVTWAERIDLKTGRPVENAAARYANQQGGRATVYPGPYGGHNWHPMSYHPGTGLVYIPAIDLPATYYTFADAPTGGVAFDAAPIDPADHAKLKTTGFLTAWDPVTQSSRWRVEHDKPFNGGTLSTAGKLVFQGNGSGTFKAYHAETGRHLWTASAGTAVQAAPISYALDGEQYVLLPAGAGGFARLFTSAYLDNVRGPARLLAFKLGADKSLPPPPPPAAVPEPPQQTVSNAVIERGRTLYNEVGCNSCHGIHAVGGGGSVKDLRYLSAQTHTEWHAIVLGGSRSDKGMPNFGAVMSVQDSDTVHAFVIEVQRDLYAARQHAKE